MSEDEQNAVIPENSHLNLEPEQTPSRHGAEPGSGSGTTGKRFSSEFVEPTARRAEDKRLLERARMGDTEAFAQLCEKYRRRVWRVVASVTKGGADTEDLAQEAILKAWSALKTYRADATFEAWLCRIALNTAHDYQRSAWKRRVLFWENWSRGEDGENSERPALPGEIIPGPDQDAERHEMQRRVRAEVAKLNEKERVPIWLIYFEEFSIADVARLENTPESTIRSRVKSGLKRLGATLGDLNVSADATAADVTEVAPKVASRPTEPKGQVAPSSGRLQNHLVEWKEGKIWA